MAEEKTPVFDAETLFKAHPQPPHEWIEVEIHGQKGRICVWGLTAGQLFQLNADPGLDASILQLMMCARTGPPPGGKYVFGDPKNKEKYLFTRNAVTAGAATRIISVSNRLSGFNFGEEDEDPTEATEESLPPS